MTIASRKRLLFYLPTLSCGGAERVAIILAQAVQAQGHAVLLVTASAHGEFSSAVPVEIPMCDLQCQRPMRGLVRFAATVRAHSPDAVLCFGMHTGIAAALSRAIFHWSAPLLVRNENNLAQEWAGASPINQLLGPPLSRWLARRSRVIAVSTQLATATAEYLRLPSEEVATILNPIESVTGATREHDALVHPWLLGRGIPTFVAMGRLEHQKGFDLLIDAFAQLSRDVSARLLIFGEGNLRAELQSRIDRYGLGDRILLPGYTPAPSAQMRAATAFVLSSRYEGFGLVLVEALAAGTRVIATDCDYGPAELLQGGRFGTLVPAGDPAALAAAMRGVLGDTPPPPRPDAAWFSQFDPVGVAQRHLALLD